jgi:hypothetical protein
MDLVRIVMLLAVFLVVGCQSESESVTPPSAPPAAENAKAMLDEMAQTGEMGSGMMELRESLEGFDEGKALLPDLDALEGMTDPEKIKAKAKEMASKL